MKIDFKVDKTRDCVVVNVEEWISPTSLVVGRLSGRPLATGIIKAVEVNESSDLCKVGIKEHDTLLLTRVAADVSLQLSYTVEGVKGRFYNAPIRQVMGIFEDGIISYESLKILHNYVAVKKVNINGGNLQLADDNTMIGEVVKVGTTGIDSKENKIPLRVKIGDTVLIRDNVATQVSLGNETLYILSEDMVVGIFKDSTYTMDNLEVINGSVLMVPYIPKTALNSTLLVPIMEYEDADYTDLYDRNMFEVVFTDPSIKRLSKGDVVLIDRNITNYVYFNTEKYFIVNGTDYIQCKIGEKNA